MSKIKKKRRVGINIDMTPMVDIAFLLLIFYMMTTSFKPPEAKAVDLPSSHSQIELPDKDIINITVTKDDSIYVDLVTKEQQTIDGKDQLTTARIVRTSSVLSIGQDLVEFRAKNIRANIVMKADERAKFGLMKKIMDAMQENDMGRFLIITDNEAS